MSESTKKYRSWISFRVKASEYEIIHGHFSKSSYHKISEYARKVLLQQPVTVHYRNQSADDFLELLLQLKKEFNALGVNYNQAVKKLHTLHHTDEVHHWLRQHDIHHQLLQQKAEEIFSLASKIHKQWLSA